MAIIIGTDFENGGGKHSLNQRSYGTGLGNDASLDQPSNK